RACRNDGERDHHGRPDQQPHMEEVALSSKVVIESVDQSKKDADRYGNAEHRCEGADMGFVLDKIGCNMKPSTGRNDGGNDCHLAVTPNKARSRWAWSIGAEGRT